MVYLDKKEGRVRQRGGRIRRLPLVVVLALLAVSPNTLGFSTGGSTIIPRRRRITITPLAAVSKEYNKSERVKKVSRQKSEEQSVVIRSSRRTPSAGPVATSAKPIKRTHPRLQRDYVSWMSPLFDHELLSKEEEQRLGIAIQRARKLREQYAAACQVKKEQQILQQLQMERLDQSFDYWDDDDEEEDLQNLSIYDMSDASSDWLADEVRLNRRQREPWAWDQDDESQRPYSDDCDALTEYEIVSMLQLPGGRSELQQILQEGAQARQEIFRGNFRLVVSIARSFSSRKKDAWTGPSFDEVVQEGIVGLATAIDRFEPTKNFRFATYATWWITNSVRKCFQTHSANIRVPTSYYTTKRKYMDVVKRHLDEGVDVPDMAVLAGEVGVSVGRLKKIIRLTQPLASLDEPVSTSRDIDGSWNLMDMLVDHEMMQPEDYVDLSFLRQNLENAMASELAPHERDVIRLRLGLDDGVRRTVKQVAQEFAPLLSVGEVRHVEKTALKKLRSPHSLSTYKLLTFLGLVGVDQRTIKVR